MSIVSSDLPSSLSVSSADSSTHSSTSAPSQSSAVSSETVISTSVGQSTASLPEPSRSIARSTAGLSTPATSVTASSGPAMASSVSRSPSTAAPSRTTVNSAVESPLSTTSKSASATARRTSDVQAAVATSGEGGSVTSAPGKPATSATPSTTALLTSLTTPKPTVSSVAPPPATSQAPPPASPTTRPSPTSEKPTTSAATRISTPVPSSATIARASEPPATSPSRATTESILAQEQSSPLPVSTAALPSTQRETEPSTAVTPQPPTQTTATSPETSATRLPVQVQNSTAEIVPSNASSIPRATPGPTSGARDTAGRVSTADVATSVNTVSGTRTSLGLSPTITDNGSGAQSALSDDKKSFFDRPAAVGGTFAGVAIALIGIAGVIFWLCRRRRTRNRSVYRRQRGISWPVPLPDNDYQDDPFTDPPRTSPIPPQMIQAGGAQHPVYSRWADAPMQEPLLPAPVVSPGASAGFAAGAPRPRSYQAAHTERDSPFADPHIGLALSKDPSLRAPSEIASDSTIGPGIASADSHAPLRPRPVSGMSSASEYEPSVLSPPPRARPVSMAESLPSMYPPSVHDDVDYADSLYTREQRASGPTVNPFEPVAEHIPAPLAVAATQPPVLPPRSVRRPSITSATPPIAPRKPIVRIASPPIPPRHQSRTMLAENGLVTPPGSDGAHSPSPPESPIHSKFEYPAAPDMTGNRIPTPEDTNTSETTPTRRTLLNIRPKPSVRM